MLYNVIIWKNGEKTVSPATNEEVKRGAVDAPQDDIDSIFIASGHELCPQCGVGHSIGHNGRCSICGFEMV